MRRLGALFLFKFLNYIFFLGGGGGEVRNIDIFWGMKILWIFFFFFGGGGGWVTTKLD